MSSLLPANARCTSLPGSTVAQVRPWQIDMSFDDDSGGDGQRRWANGLTPELFASQIVADAQSEADHLAFEAKRTADLILERARQEAEDIKAQAYSTGLVQGQLDGKQEIWVTLSTQKAAEIQSMQQALQEIVDAFLSQRQAVWEQTETEMLEFVMEVSKKVLQTELEIRPEMTTDIIRHALRRVVDKENVRIRVNPSELSSVRAHREDLILLLDGIKNLEIVDDRRIGNGGCVIETNAGTIDARIETQMAQIKDAMIPDKSFETDRELES